MIKTLRAPYSYLHGAFQFIIWRTKYSNELPTSEQFLIGVLTRPPRRNFVHLFGRSNSSASKNFYPFMRWMVLIKKFVRQKDGWTSGQSANGHIRLLSPGGEKPNLTFKKFFIRISVFKLVNFLAVTQAENSPLRREKFSRKIF